MPERGEGIRLVVKALGKSEHFYTVENPTVMPRQGEVVRFADADAVVEKVTWDPLAHPKPTVIVECARKP